MTHFITEYQAIVVSLENLFHQYHHGNKESFVSIAGELCKLLCSGRNASAIPLLQQVLPEARLHPLFWTKFYHQNPQLVAPVSCYMSGGAKVERGNEISYNLLLDITGERLPVEQWVKQPFVDPEITIEKFINLMANFDRTALEDSCFAAHARMKSELFENPESYSKLTLAIAEYILTYVKIASLQHEHCAQSTHDRVPGSILAGD